MRPAGLVKLWSKWRLIWFMAGEALALWEFLQTPSSRRADRCLVSFPNAWRQRSWRIQA